MPYAAGMVVHGPWDEVNAVPAALEGATGRRLPTDLVAGVLAGTRRDATKAHRSRFSPEVLKAMP